MVVYYANLKEDGSVKTWTVGLERWIYRSLLGLTVFYPWRSQE